MWHLKAQSHASGKRLGSEKTIDKKKRRVCWIQNPDKHLAASHTLSLLNQVEALTSLEMLKPHLLLLHPPSSILHSP